MTETTSANGTKAKGTKGKGKPAAKPVSARRAQFLAECGKFCEALAALSEAEDLLFELVPVDDRADVSQTCDVLRSYLFSNFPV